MDFVADFIVGNHLLDVSFRNLKTRNAHHYSMTIYSQNGRLDYDVGGRRASWSISGPDDLHPESFSLTGKTQSIRSDFSKIMEDVYFEVSNQMGHLGNHSILTTGAEALQVSRILDEIEGAHS